MRASAEPRPAPASHSPRAAEESVARTEVQAIHRRAQADLCPACQSARVEEMAQLPYVDTFYKWGVPAFFHSHVKPWFGDVRIPVSACQDCGLHFTPSRPTGLVEVLEDDPNYFSLVVGGYLEDSQPLVTPAWLEALLAADPGKLSHFDLHHRKQLEFVADKISGEDRFLDLGCNMGAFAEMVRLRYGPRAVAGCEINEHYCEALVKRYPHLKLFTGPLDWEKSGAQYDVIFCSHVIEHVWDLDGFLHSIVEHLASNGRLIFATPNLDCESAKIKGFQWWGYIVPHHCQLFTKDAMSALLKRSGLSDVAFVEYGDELNVTCRKAA